MDREHSIRDPSRSYGSKGASLQPRANGSAPSPSKMHRNGLPSPTGASYHTRRSPTNSDDSASSAGRRNAFVAKYGADARNALERIRRTVNDDPFVAAHTRTSGSSRLGAHARTSLGLQLNGNRVTGVVKGSPAFLVQRFSPGDEILGVDGLEVVPAEVAKAMIGSDKPGSAVRLQVRSSVTRRVEEIEVTREDVELVKMHRSVYESLELLGEAAPDASTRAQVEGLAAAITKAHLRTFHHHSEVRHLVALQHEAARQAVDEVYASVGKLEGAYSGGQGRTHRLADEVERLTRELAEVKSHLDVKGQSYLDVKGQFDMKGHPLPPPRAAEIEMSPDMNPEQGREVAMLQAKMESVLAELLAVRRERDDLQHLSDSNSFRRPPIGVAISPLPQGADAKLVQRLQRLEEENKTLASALAQSARAQSARPLPHYPGLHFQPPEHGPPPGAPQSVYGGARGFLQHDDGLRGDGFRDGRPGVDEFHPREREPQGALGSGFFSHLSLDPDLRAPPSDGARMENERRLASPYELQDPPPLPSIVDEMAM